MLAGMVPIRARKARYYEDSRLARRVLPPPAPGRFAAAAATNGWTSRPALAATDPSRTSVPDGSEGEDSDPRALVPALDAPASQPDLDEFDFDDAPLEDLAALETRRLDRRQTGTARQAAMDPNDGVEL